MEQKEIKKITLSELIDVANKYTSGEWDSEKLNEYGQTMTIRPYIPLIDKTARIMAIIQKYNEKYNSYEYRMLDLYRNIFFDIILSEYAFIDCNKKDLITSENYDLLYPIFANYIINFCRIDYDNFIAMLMQTINMYNSQGFIDVMRGLDIRTLEDVVNSNTEMLEILNKNKEVINKLDDIARMNDPQLAAMSDEIKKYAMDEIAKI